MTTTATKKKAKTRAKKDVYQIVTDRIVEALEGGIIPWRRPWKRLSNGGLGFPTSVATGKPYHGVNVWLLALTADAMGYASHLWLTFNQAKKLGGRVRKGEKGTQVVFWKVVKKDEADSAGVVREKKMFFLRYYTVFNVEQCDDLPEKFTPLPDEIEESEELADIEMCASIVAEMPGRPTIKHGGDRACYFLGLDKIHMPAKKQFGTMEAYYATLFHELVHSTGAKHRLARHNEDEYKPHIFGSPNYSREELVAETGSAMLCALTGIDLPEIQENEAAYIGNWMKALKADPRAVIVAAGRGMKAADYILGEHETSNDDDE